MEKINQPSISRIDKPSSAISRIDKPWFLLRGDYIVSFDREEFERKKKARRAASAKPDAESVQTSPHRFSAWEMAKFGVEIKDHSRIGLSCFLCGQHWSPNIQSGGRLPRGYWKCPNGCNY